MIDRFIDWMLDNDRLAKLLFVIVFCIVGPAACYFLGIDGRVVPTVFLFLFFYVGYRVEKKEHPEKKHAYLLVLGGLMALGVFLH